MKTQFLKKVLALILGAVMLLSMVACDNNPTPISTTAPDSTKGTENNSPETTGTVEAPGVTFPLAEEMTFTIMYKGNGTDINAMLEKCAFWQDMYKATNVKIEFIELPADGTMNTLNAMFMSNEEGDAILSHFIKDADYAQMTANGLLQSLNEYINNVDLMPNFNERVLGESPATLGTITSPDGNIYSLPSYTPDLGGLLESPLYINQAWLDNLGLKVPTTMAELEAVLVAFRDNDCNGNGLDDEIPLLLQQGNSYSHFEAFMGLYGIATKDGTNENYVYLEDGTVVFAPTSQAYKDCIIQLNDWYEKEMIWQEAFTSNTDTWVAKISSEIPCIGVIPMQNMAGYNEQYVPFAPVEVEGYETSWYIHPGVAGVKTRFAVTRSCENVDVLMAWIDMFYSYENSIRIKYGEESDGRYSIVDGALIDNGLSKDEQNALKESAPRLLGDILSNVPIALTAGDYDEGRIVKSGASLNTQAAYDVYKDYLNDEIWPRPYFGSDVSTRLGELRTDIFSLVNQKKADWITGNSDINAEWDAYCASLEKMGVAELIELMQGAYDNYKAANN